jgi:NAD(P)H-hydrate epimerase
MEEALVLSREQVRRIDALAVDKYGMSSLVLMENAGRGVVDVLLQHDPSLGRVHEMHGDRDEAVHFMHPTVAILCGKGNNAGDGFVVARHLEIRGAAAKVLLLCSPSELTGDARQNYEVLTHSDVPIVDVSAGPVDALLDEHAAGAAWLVDAMLGTGARGEPRAPFDAAIAWMNRQKARRLAVDVPSGLDCDTGAKPPLGRELGAERQAAVRADLTCTFLALKPGFLLPQAREFLGQVHVVDIGVPPRLVREAAGA